MGGHGRAGAERPLSRIPPSRVLLSRLRRSGRRRRPPRGGLPRPPPTPVGTGDRGRGPTAPRRRPPERSAGEGRRAAPDEGTAPARPTIAGRRPDVRPVPWPCPTSLRKQQL